jgi:DNA adenine methylase
LRKLFSLHFYITQKEKNFKGGKSRAVDHIVSYLPEFEEFREPFLGGGSVLIRLKQKYPNKIFWGNDLYPELFKFWEYAQKDMGTLTNKINEWRKHFPVGRELFRFLNQTRDTFHGLERAAAFFIYNRITFSGTSLSGGFSESAFQKRFTESSIQRLKPFADVIQDIKITNDDYKNSCKRTGTMFFYFSIRPIIRRQNPHSTEKTGISTKLLTIKNLPKR